MPKAGTGHTAVTITREERTDLDVLCATLAGRLGRRLKLGETITEARRAVATSADVARLRELIGRMDWAHSLEDQGEREVAMSRAWSDLGDFLTSRESFGVSDLPPHR